MTDPARCRVTIAIVTTADVSRVGQTRRIDRPIVVGRDPGCDLVVNDPNVSRRHARIEREPGGLKVSDLGSANGLWVGADRVFEAHVAGGQRFRIGSTVIECVQPQSHGTAGPAERPGDHTVFMTVPAVTAGPVPPVSPARPALPVLPSAPVAGVAPAPLVPSAAEERSLAGEGESIEANAHRPFLINDPDAVYYIEAGGVLLFTVAVEHGHPVGPRTHFMDVAARQCFFGFDLSLAPGSGFLAVPKPSTKLRRLTRERLRQLAVIRPAELSAAIEAWISSLLRSWRGGGPGRDGDVVEHWCGGRPANLRARDVGRWGRVGGHPFERCSHQRHVVPVIRTLAGGLPAVEQHLAPVHRRPGRRSARHADGYRRRHRPPRVLGGH